MFKHLNLASLILATTEATPPFSRIISKACHKSKRMDGEKFQGRRSQSYNLLLYSWQDSRTRWLYNGFLPECRDFIKEDIWSSQSCSSTLPHGKIQQGLFHCPDPQKEHQLVFSLHQKGARQGNPLLSMEGLSKMQDKAVINHWI